MSNSPGSPGWSSGATMSPPSNSRDGRAYEMAICFRAPLALDSTSSSLLTAILSFSRIFFHSFDLILHPFCIERRLFCTTAKR